MKKEFEANKNRLVTSFEPIVLNETLQTRLVAYPHKFPDSGLRLEFSHQKKSKKQSWEEIPHFNKRLLQAGECVGLELDTKATKILLENLPKLAEAAKIDLQYGITHIATLDGEHTIVPKDDVQELNTFRTLVENKRPEEIKTLLDQVIPEVIKRVSELEIIDARRKTLEQFNEELQSQKWKEKEWQAFFDTNQWIFGYGTHFCYLEQLRKEGYCGGKDDSNGGGQIVDFIMASVMEKARFTVLVEIKTPETVLIKNNHRNRVYTLADELISSVSQIQYYCNRWEREGSLLPETLKQHAQKSIYTYSPKGILIIGHSKQFENEEDKFATFELYRRGLHNIDILTYDELYHRAEWVVSKAFNNT